MPTVNHAGEDTPPLNHIHPHERALAGSSKVDQLARVSTNHVPGTSNSAPRFPEKEHHQNGQVSNLHFLFAPWNSMSIM